MIKINGIALAISALFMAGTANAAEIYNKDGNKLDLFGRMEGAHYFSKDNGSDGDATYGRFGFQGETQISNQLSGYAEWEYQINANNTEANGSTNNATRVAYAGLRFGDSGSFDYGRSYGVMYDVAGWTDVLPAFGGDTYSADNFMFQRSNGLATYRSNNLFGLVQGLNFAVQYQGKNSSATESTNGRDVLGQNGDGWGLSTNYDLGNGLSIGGAMFSSNRTQQQNGVNGGDDNNYSNIQGRGAKAKAYTMGLKYDQNNVYLAAMLTRAYNAIKFGTYSSNADNAYGFANKANNVELVAQYQFDFGLRPSLAFISSRGSDIGQYGSQNLKKYVDIGTTYYFNKNMSTYVDYQVNLMKSNDFTQEAGINTDNIVALGLIYQF